MQNASRLARRLIAVFPLAFLAHVLEEWFGGFSAWTADALGREMSAERFLLINGIAVPLSALVVVLGLRFQRFLPAALVVVTVLTLNGALHVLATVGFGAYSPGTVTSVLLYLPLGGTVLIWARQALPSSDFGGVLAAAVAVHAVIVMVALG
jgi:hypothetical protein